MEKAKIDFLFPRTIFRGIAKSGFLLFVASFFLMASAIYNGYPLVWPDTGGYIHLVNLTFRTPFYNLFIYPMHLKWSLWPIVLWQSLMISHLVYLTVRVTFGPVRFIPFLLIIVCMMVLSSLPWITGLIMPDIFTPVLTLSLFLLAFCHDRLKRKERIYLYLMIVLAVTVHLSHIPFAIGLIAFMAFFFFTLKKDRRVHIKRCLSLMLPVIIAIGIALTNNLLAHGCLTLSVGGYAFPLSRLIADGPAVAYLKRNCPQENYDICNHLDQLPDTSDDFLWATDSPFHKMGWFKGYRDEGRRILLGTVCEFPYWTFKNAVKNTFKQLMKFQTGSGLFSYLTFDYPTIDIRKHFPTDYPYYEESRQSTGRLNLGPIRRLHNMVLMITLFLSIYTLFVFIQERNRAPAMLFVTILVSILINSCITGALSGPFDRYLSRMIWLIPFFGIAGTFSILENWRERYLSKQQQLLRNDRHQDCDKI